MIDTSFASDSESAQVLAGLGKGQFVLRVCGSKYDGRIVRLSSQKCSIGSGAGCTLRLSGAGIDPLHCLVLRGERGAFIRRWSANTHLNGEPFTDAQLKVGDRLSVGPVELEVLENASPEHSIGATGPLDAEHRDSNDLAKLQQSLSSSRQTSKSRVRKLIGELRATRQRINDFETNSDRTARDVEQLNQRIEQLQSELAGLESRGESHNQDRESWQQEQSRLQAQLDEQSKQLETLTCEAEDTEQPTSDTWQEERQQLEDQLAQTKQAARDRNKLAEELDEKEAKLTDALEQAAHLRQRLEDIERNRLRQTTRESDIRKSESVLDERAKSIDEARVRMNQEREELELHRSQLDAQRRLVDEKLEAERKEIAEEQERLRTELDERESRLAEREGKLELQTQKLELAVASLEKQPILLDEQETTQPNVSETIQLDVEETVDEQQDEAELPDDDPPSVPPVNQTLRLQLGDQPEVCEPADAQHHEDEPPHDDSPPVPPVNQTRRLQPGDQPESCESASSASDFSPNQTLQLPLDEPREDQLLASEPEIVLEAPTSVEREEELSYETTEDVAPLSTADVLARMGHTPSFEDEDQKEQENQEDHAERRRVPRPTQEVLTSQSEDDSIENYMSRLLKRVRGEDTVVFTSKPDDSAASAGNAENRVSNDTLQTEADEPEAMCEEDYLPRRPAPEWSKDLTAMRELANQTARSAIQTSDSLRERSEVVDRMLVIVAASVIGLMLLLLSNSVFSLTVFGGLVCFCVAFVWTLKVIKIKRRLREQSEQVEESPSEAAVDKLLDAMPESEEV